MRFIPSNLTLALMISATALAAPVGAQPRRTPGPTSGSRHVASARAPLAASAPEVLEAQPPSRRECSMFAGELGAHCVNVVDALGGAVEAVARGTPEAMELALGICDEVEATAPTLIRALQHDTRGVTHATASSGVLPGAAVLGSPTALRNALAFCAALRRVHGRCTAPAVLPPELEGALATVVTGTITLGSAYRLALETQRCPSPPPVRAPVRVGLALSVGAATSMIAATRDRFAPAAVSVAVGPAVQAGRWHVTLRGLIEVSPFEVAYNGAPSSQVATLVGARGGVGYAIVSGAHAQLVTGLDIGGGYFFRTLSRGDLPSNATQSQGSGVFLAGGFVRMQTALSDRWSLLAEVNGGYRLFTSVNLEVGNDFILGASMGGSYGF